MVDLIRTDPQEVEQAIWSGFSGTVAFDVGAHRGESVKFIEALGFKDIYLFEPDPLLFGELTQNFREYRLVYDAVSDHVGQLPLQYGKGMLRNPAIDGLDWTRDGRTLTVSTITLDFYCNTYELTPDFIKVDTEGFEVAVARGAAEIIKAKHAAWLFEFHSEENAKELYRMFYDDYRYEPSLIRHPYYQENSHLWRNHGWLRWFPS